MKNTGVGVVALLLLSACASGEKPADTTNTAVVAPSPESDRARAAANVANAIAANPAAADSILTAAGYTRDSFQALMYEIAADSVMSNAYAAAKNR